MRGRALFDKVVELCGISGVLGPGLVRRALSDGDVAPDEATPADYEAALPRLRTRLATYVPEEEASARIRRIAGLLAHLEGGLDSGAVVEALRAADADLDPKASRDRMMQTGERVKEGCDAPREDDHGKDGTNGG